MKLFIKRNEKRKKWAHIIAGVVILLHGYEKLEKEESSYWIFFLFGIIFIMLAVFHKQLAQKIRWVDVIFYGIEALMLAVIAYDYWHHGKKGLPLAYSAAAIGYIVVAIVVFQRSKRAIAVH